MKEKHVLILFTPLKTKLKIPEQAIAVSQKKMELLGHTCLHKSFPNWIVLHTCSEGELTLKRGGDSLLHCKGEPAST